MKLLLLSLLTSLSSFAINIQQITVSPININDLNIKVNVVEGNVIEYYSYDYEIIQNTIILNICYSNFFLNTVTYLENNIQITNVNSSENNFVLIVNVFKRRLVNNIWSCTSSIGFDTETILFSTPLTNPVSLSNTAFEQSYKISIFPNPATTTFQVHNQNIKEISVYDNFGRLVKEFLKPHANYDISDLSNGIYYLQAQDFLGNVFKEKLIKK